MFSIRKAFGYATSLIPTALLITGVAILESVGIAKVLAAKNGYELVCKSRGISYEWTVLLSPQDIFNFGSSIFRIGHVVPKEWVRGNQ